MKKLIIKGHKLDEGRPLICVPVIEQKRADILHEIDILCKKGAAMIEWRADWYEDVKQPEAVAGILKEMQPLVSDTILLVTFRSRAQGGERELTQEQRRAFYCMAAESDAADIVDVESFETADVAELVQTLQKKGTAVIASHHNFQKTPEDGELKQILEQLAESGADIVKLAVMPNEVTDVFRLLSVTHDFKEAHRELPVVTMSMGGYGVISRICGELYGSCITFGSHEKPSAPGQLQMDALAQILDTLHEAGER